MSGDGDGAAPTASGTLKARELSAQSPAEGASAAALRDAFVVPRLLLEPAELLLEMLAVGESAQIAHLGCGTGFPDAELLSRLGRAELYGCDASPAMVQLAQSKAVAQGLPARYLTASPTATPWPDQSFTHVFSLHVESSQRAALLREARRLLAPGGQLLCSLLLRGAAQELTCLLREYALSSERAVVDQAIEQVLAARPTPEQLHEELEAAGFQFVEVEHRRAALPFSNGRSVQDDPVMRQVLWTEYERASKEPFDGALSYVRRAVDAYWSRGVFELSLSHACVSARRM